MPHLAPDAAAAFLIAAREAFAALCAQHLSAEQQRAAAAAIRAGTPARMIVDVNTGQIRAALILPKRKTPIELFVLAPEPQAEAA